MGSYAYIYRDVLAKIIHMQAGPAYAEAFLSVVRNVTKEDTVQYVLALLDDMLSGRMLHSHSRVPIPVTADAVAQMQVIPSSYIIGSLKIAQWPAEDSSRAQLFHRQSGAQEKQTESYSIFLRSVRLDEPRLTFAIKTMICSLLSFQRSCFPPL